MKIKCNFEVDIDLFNKEGVEETDTKKYEEYITFLISKAYSKTLVEFFEETKKNEPMFKGLSKQLDKQSNELKSIMENIKVKL